MSGYKYVKILPPITHRGITLRHRDVIMHSLSTDQHFNNAGRAARRAGDRIEDELDPGEKLGYWRFTTEDQALLLQALDKPIPMPGAVGYITKHGVLAETGEPVVISLAKQSLPFIDAVEKATDSEPVEIPANGATAVAEA